jgi:type 1 fimbriae regulatory protein FimB
MKNLDKTMTGRKGENASRSDSDRKHLTGREVERLIEATTGSRTEARDRCLLLMMLRHGLRVSEACGLKLDQVDIESHVLHVARLKGGLSTTQPLRGDELRAVGACLKERARLKPAGKAFFVSGQRKPLHRSTVNLALEKYSAPRFPAPARPSPHAAPCLRLRAGRPGRGYEAHPGLPGAPEHPAHRKVQCDL